MNAAVSIRGLSHRYRELLALNDLSLEITAGEIFAVLGPNGSGKSTLFRLLSTLVPVQQGEIVIAGAYVTREPHLVRQKLGVVFQSPSVDKKLTVRENLRLQAAMYNWHGAMLEKRIDELLEQFNLADRQNELCERLSGGMRRRVELAKGILHKPDILLLDEPSTGLDPGARLDLWQCFQRLQSERKVTILLTTHLLDEAAKATRLAILDRGKLVAHDTPAALQATVGGETLTLKSARASWLAEQITGRFQLPATSREGSVRLEVPSRGYEWLPRIVEAFPGEIREIVLSQPTLEDVFIAKTGHAFHTEEPRE